jgi:hypothetical protein
MYRGPFCRHVGTANKQTFNVITTPFHVRADVADNCDKTLPDLTYERLHCALNNYFS